MHWGICAPIPFTWSQATATSQIPGEHARESGFVYGYPPTLASGGSDQPTKPNDRTTGSNVGAYTAGTSHAIDDNKASDHSRATDEESRLALALSIFYGSMEDTFVSLIVKAMEEMKLSSSSSGSSVLNPNAPPLSGPRFGLSLDPPDLGFKVAAPREQQSRTLRLCNGGSAAVRVNSFRFVPEEELFSLKIKTDGRGGVIMYARITSEDDRDRSGAREHVVRHAPSATRGGLSAMSRDGWQARRSARDRGECKCG